MANSKCSSTRESLQLERDALSGQRIAMALEATDPRGMEIHKREATEKLSMASEWMEADRDPVVQHGEILPEGVSDKAYLIRDTLATPDAVAIDASRERTDLLLKESFDIAGMAVDAATSVGAENSIEKMLAHQLALAHKAAFELADKGMRLTHKLGSTNDNPQSQQLVSQEACRLMNASARMMQAFQQGVLSLQKMRTGGRQVVTVQHVQVSSGGQAVIAGGGVVTGGAAKNG